MVNRYRKGRIAEKKVMNYLKKKGYTNIRRSKGSRGPADIYARKGNTKYYIQVKSGTAKMSSKERRRLRRLAIKRKGVAVVIHRTEKGKYKWRFYGRWK